MTRPIDYQEWADEVADKLEQARLSKLMEDYLSDYFLEMMDTDKSLKHDET